MVKKALVGYLGFWKGRKDSGSLFIFIKNNVQQIYKFEYFVIIIRKHIFYNYSQNRKYLNFHYYPKYITNLFIFKK